MYKYTRRYKNYGLEVDGAYLLEDGYWNGPKYWKYSFFFTLYRHTTEPKTKKNLI